MSNLVLETPAKLRPSWLTRCFIVLFLAVQFGLPLRALLTKGSFFKRQLGSDFPFTWSMYSCTRGKPKLVAFYTNGKKKKLRPEKQVGPFAARVRYGDFLPRLLCDKNSRIARIERKSKRKQESFEC